MLRLQALSGKRNPDYWSIKKPFFKTFHRSTWPPSPKFHDLAHSCSAPFTLIISIKKRFPGQAQSAILAAFSCDVYLKHVIVVDEDVQITNLQEVIWAVATRVQGDRDMVIIPGVRGSSLDPSCGEEGVVTKMGIDATAKPSLSAFPRRNKVPQEVLDRTPAGELPEFG